MNNFSENRKRNYISTGLMVTAFAVAVGLLYGYFYDLNDDVLMKDILSGVYTGKPEGHNIQMLYPVSLIISIFYRIIRAADWYGLYLLVCQYLSLSLIIDFVAGKTKKTLKAAAFVLLICSSLMLGHFVIVQYTFAVAMMCGAAAVLIAEGRDKMAMAFIVVAFLTRSEMTLLMLPMVMLVLFFRFIDNFRESGAFKKALTCFLMIVAGLLVSEGLHFAGYSSAGWREFNSFFDSRTEVYDFYQVPDYDENKEFYDSIGLDKTEYELLINYNFGLDDEINADTMKKIAEYAASIKHEESILSRLKTALPKYFYRLRSVSLPKSFEYPMTDSPWNIVTFLLYLYVIIMGCMAMKKSGVRDGVILLGKAAVLFLGRSSLWLYILVRGRDPIRITHSLYMLEIIVLVTVIAGIHAGDGTEESESKPFYKKPLNILAAILAVVMLIYIPFQAGVTGRECTGRREYNEVYEILESYFEEHSENFYFVDVYSSVAYEDNGYTYSQKMFDTHGNKGSNSILMGGWASKSPIEKKKLAAHGLSENMQDAVLAPNSFIAADKDTDMQWFTGYYEAKGISVSLKAVDEIAGEFVIYMVNG
ncbi:MULTISPECIES: hypothetical protein [unclassified Butyrivibrio]|uniref:hypothetical protein n=1 Tax=unclassified Butyrivibrio TaxID=2639466 RepID=UPI00040F5665|nr:MULTISPECIES: hypothetical protein [unclassified Butyrivibrio]